MSAPEYIDILNTFSYYQNISDEKYYIIIKVLEDFFLIRVDDCECNLHNLFNWIYEEQKKRYKKFMNKPIKCLFNTYYTSKYKSLLANGGDKLKHILNSVDGFEYSSSFETPFTKNDIKIIIQDCINNVKDKAFERYIEEEINIEVLNKLNNDVNVIQLMYHYNFVEFLLTFEVPYIVKDKSIVYIFHKKELNKFLFDFRFLYYTFMTNNKNDALNMILVFKKYLEC